MLKGEEPGRYHFPPFLRLTVMNLRLLLLLLPFFSAGLCPAEARSELISPEEESPLPAETQKSLTSLETMLKELAQTLESIVDADSAGRHAAAVEYLIQELYATDYAAFEGGDEEVIAAGLETLFVRIDQNMVRLDDADFYGNVDLKRVFGADESAVLQAGEQGYGTPDAGEQPSGVSPDTEKASEKPGEGVLKESGEKVQEECREGVSAESGEAVQGGGRPEEIRGESREEPQGGCTNSAEG